jgi:hypothetical protein
MELDPETILDEAVEEFIRTETAFLRGDPSELELIQYFASYLRAAAAPLSVTTLNPHQGLAEVSLLEPEGDEGDHGWGAFKSVCPDLTVHSSDYSLRLLMVELKAMRPTGMISPYWDRSKLEHYTKTLDYPAPRLGYSRGALFFVPTGTLSLQAWGFDWFEAGQFLYSESRRPGEF